MAPFMAKSNLPSSNGPSRALSPNHQHRATTPSGATTRVNVKKTALSKTAPVPKRPTSGASLRTPGARTPQSVGSRTPQIRSGHGSAVDLTQTTPTSTRTRTKPATNGTNSHQHY